MQVFLLPELLTVVALGLVVSAFPQNLVPANATAIISPINQISVTPSETLWAGDWQIDPCQVTFDPKTCEGRGIHVLPTATGWDDTIVDSPGFVPPTQINRVISSYVPTIINVETKIAVHNGPASTSVVDSESDGHERQPNTLTQHDTNGTPRQSRDGNTRKTIYTIEYSGAQKTPQNSLLLEIVSQLGGIASDTQPTPTILHRTDVSLENFPTHSTANPEKSSQSRNSFTQPQITPNATVPTLTAIGGSITLGPTTLTLTPGLSTTLGMSPDATLIAISTDAAGNTLVTISFSGVAVIATVSTIPTMVTLPKIGFEASITDVARPADHTSALRTTSSQGGVVGQSQSETGLWLYLMLGVMGLLFGP